VIIDFVVIMEKVGLDAVRL